MRGLGVQHCFTSELALLYDMTSCPLLSAVSDLLILLQLQHRDAKIVILRPLYLHYKKYTKYIVLEFQTISSILDITPSLHHGWSPAGDKLV